MIQKYNIIFFLKRHNDGFVSAFRRIDAHAGIFKKADKNGKIHGRIVHDKDFRFRRRELFVIFLLRRGSVSEGFFVIAEGAPFCYLLLQPETKRRTDSIGTLNDKRTVHQPKKAHGNGHPKPRSLNIPVLLLFDALKL